MRRLGHINAPHGVTGPFVAVRVVVALDGEQVHAAQVSRKEVIPSARRALVVQITRVDHQVHALIAQHREHVARARV